MTVKAWLDKAKRIHTTCANQQRAGNGGGRLTGAQARTLNDLQHAIGSHHSASSVTYNEARTSLDEMFTMVKAGTKTPPLTP